MYVFDLPEVGEGVVEGELLKWLVSEGETVTADQPICEIMTDKATIEISSPKTGRVAKLHGQEGQVIVVHTPLIEIDLDGKGGDTSTVVEKPQPKAIAPQPPASVPEPAPVPAPSRRSAPAQQPSSRPSQAKASGGKVLASPAVRDYAMQQGVDLTTIVGSGRGGRITRADINAEQGGISNSSFIKAPPAISAPRPAAGQDEVRKISGLRRMIAKSMVKSAFTAPHFTYVDELDATNLVAMRKDLKQLAADKGTKLTYLPFFMKALVMAFREFPTLNATIDEEEFALTIRGTVNIGIATDTPRGLYVPVIKNVESKSIMELANEVIDLTNRTREGTVRPEELKDGTFTITSVGNIGGRFATPIIRHPEVAILGLNQIHDRPMVIDGEIVARKMMYLSPSFDHRVIDGAVAARFVSLLKNILETPARLILDLR
jgi:pyruvate dehydrogenase E2 component (dihydrolipoamide acetyltransferase)